MARTCSWRVTSVSTTSALPPAERIVSALRSAVARSTSAIATRAPSSARRREVAPPRAEAADGSTPETALPLRGEQDGSIPGGVGGHFAYFRFAYPGGWPLHLELRPNTEDKLVLKYVGYKVYGPEPQREYVDARLDENDVWQGGRDLVSDDRGVYYVQVYNYNPNPGTALSFTLVADGIPPQPESGQSAPGPVRGSAGHVAIPLEGTQTGTLAAEAGGSFRYYQ